MFWDSVLKKKESPNFLISYPLISSTHFRDSVGHTFDVYLMLKTISGIMFIYIVILMTRFSVGVIMFGKYQYTYSAAYCWIHIDNDTYKWVDLYLAMILLSAPILPILCSALITTYYLFKSGILVMTCNDL